MAEFRVGDRQSPVGLPLEPGGNRIATAISLISAVGKAADTGGIPTVTVGIPAGTVGIPADAVGIPASTVGIPADTVGIPAGTV